MKQKFFVHWLAYQVCTPIEIERFVNEYGKILAEKTNREIAVNAEKPSDNAHDNAQPKEWILKN